MDRLTSKDIVAGVEIFDLKVGVPEEKAFNLLGQYENTGLTPAEAMELAQAKADGLLVVLPCKVGDTVYYINPYCGECKNVQEYAKVIVEGVPCPIAYTNKCAMRIDEEVFEYGYFTDFGKTVFLTLSEAQAAIERMEGQE